MNLANEIRIIDPTFWNRCAKYKRCDIDEEFMGFTDIYEHLAQIIPKDRIIVDLGCAYAPQAIYFTEHKKYIGVDLPNFKTPRVKTKNSKYDIMTIKDWIKNELPKYKKEKIFAICSYVPPWHGDNQKLVRENFLDVFVYYPR
jgi:hypothetical protein